MPRISEQLTGFTELAASVGFEPMEAPQMELANSEGAEFWRNEFALLVLADVESTSEALKQSLHVCSDIIARYLTQQQGNRRLIDGYLLLLMPTKPDEALRPVVQQIELNTSVCRKHVIWPDEDGNWSSALGTVTTLGLPEVTFSLEPITEPEIPAIARQALAALRGKKSFRDVAGEIEEMPEPTTEVSDAD